MTNIPNYYACVIVKYKTLYFVFCGLKEVDKGVKERLSNLNVGQPL